MGVNTCHLCNQVDHSTELCALRCSDYLGINSYLGYHYSVRPIMSNKLDKQGHSQVFFDGKEVCNNFNNERAATE